MDSVTILGEPRASGAYVLRICVEEPLALSFGRFQGGRAVPLAGGEYAYVGSAMGVAGSSTLARRVLRHATRSGLDPPHAVRGALLDRLQTVGLLEQTAARPSVKRLRWHVDYLLDHSCVQLTGVLLVCSATRQEAALARLLAADPQTVAPALGLGASDAPGATHLHAIDLTSARALAAWWDALTERIRVECATNASTSA